MTWMVIKPCGYKHHTFRSIKIYTNNANKIKYIIPLPLNHFDNDTYYDEAREFVKYDDGSLYVSEEDFIKVKSYETALKINDITIQAYKEWEKLQYVRNNRS